MLWWLLLVLVLGSLAVLILAPLRAPRQQWGGSRQSELDQLLAEKQKTLRALVDLEHERQNGMLDAADYAETRRQHLERAAWINRLVGELVGLGGPSGRKPGADDEEAAAARPPAAESARAQSTKVSDEA